MYIVYILYLHYIRGYWVNIYIKNKKLRYANKKVLIIYRAKEV